MVRRAETEFFMWAAGDDHWYPDFANRCIAELDANPSIVLATPLIAFEQEGEAAGLSDATYPLVGAIDANIRRYLLAPGDNSRMYGVFRTGAGQRSFPASSFHAYDWAFCAATLRFGGHAEIPEVLMVRDLTPVAKGKAAELFIYKDKGSMAVIGRRKAVVDIHGRSFGGTLAWLMWMFVHVLQLVGFRNRMVVLFNWAWKYLSWKNTIRLIIRPYVRRNTVVSRPFAAHE